MLLLVRAVLAAALLTTGLTGASLALTTAPAAAATCPSPGGVRVPEAAASGDVVFRGHGWGHGLGMSQYGAEGAAKLGCTYSQILKAYYTGSRVSTETMPTDIYLRMLNNGGYADLTAETRAVAWQVPDAAAPGGWKSVVTQPKGSTYRIRRSTDRTKLEIVDRGATGTVLWASTGPTQAVRLSHAGTVVHLVTYVWSASAGAYTKYMDRRLKWDLTRFAYDGDALDAVQIIRNNSYGTGMQKYLWGIAEVPTLFPTAALRAQAVAARTYAARLGGGSLTQPLMPTPADQNYTGYAKESEDAQYGNRWKNAVTGTDGKVLRDGSGKFVTTYYSSSMGGHTEDVRYVGWSSAAVPYLSGIDDSRWEMASGNKAANRSWAKAFSWETLAAKFGFSEVSSVWVPARGTSARFAGVRIRGIKGGSLVTSYVSGWDVRQTLGLLSPNFTIRMTLIGGAAAQPITGDWNGDGKAEPGWFKNGEFALNMGGWTKRFGYGSAGDVPVVGDWDGDGDDDIGVFRNGGWYLRKGLSAGPTSLRFDYGQAGDRPVVGRWNGTGLGIGVVRGREWYLRHTLTGGPTQVRFAYGLASDRVVVGDWDQDGDTTPGVVRGTQWGLRRGLATGGSDPLGYGLSSDRPVAGDWNGDGRSTVGIARGTTFHLRDVNTTGVATSTVTFTG